MNKTPAVTSQAQIDPPLEAKLASVASMLGKLERSSGSAIDSGELTRELAILRLGMASSLFQSLRKRHAPTADHSLRVALLCSGWSLATDISDADRDELEVAALLHDLGKVAAPDEILHKPGPLTEEQTLRMDRARRDGIEILAVCCKQAELLKMIAYAGGWYDGSRTGYALSGSDIPLGSRMIAIADAFDSMTSHQVYRHPFSQERAISELFRCAGTQFDAQLVEQFAFVQSAGQLYPDEKTARHWLLDLAQQNTDRFWERQTGDLGLAANNDLTFHEQLFHSTPDGVFYVNEHGIVTHWNRATERITGIRAEAMLQRRWEPDLVRITDPAGEVVGSETCPILWSLRTRQKWRGPLILAGRDDRLLQIDLHAHPIVTQHGAFLGVTVQLRDDTSAYHLDERVRVLHRRATRDALTGLANRAEFDRFHREAIRRHAASNGTCSLIICDIDNFKAINDEFGHQSGDQALTHFAALLQRSCREGDLVARYGGEEFVMVCADCTANEATRLADLIRQQLAQTPMAELNGRSITASFGVTELQSGDDPATMLRRADRGLLRAKQTGKNKVVQLGTGKEPDANDAAAENYSTWWTRLKRGSVTPSLECTLLTNVPRPLVVEKLFGFISDHCAEIVRSNEQLVELNVTTGHFYRTRRENDRPISFSLHIEMTEGRREGEAAAAPAGPRGARVHVRLTTRRLRDRRVNVQEAGQLLLQSLRAYLMAQIETPPE